MVSQAETDISDLEADVAALDSVRVYRGSKILAYSGQGAILFTPAQLRSLTGVSYSVERYTVLCCNGDPKQAAGFHEIFSVMDTDGVIAQCDEMLTGNHRVNWTVVVTR